MNPDLYQVDENIAVLSSFYEMIDFLKKLFCLCHRCMKFYLVRLPAFGVCLSNLHSDTTRTLKYFLRSPTW